MAVYDSSLLGDEDPAEREAAFSQILEAAVDPAMEMCKRMADLKKDISDWDKAIFLINCTTYMQVRSSPIMSVGAPSHSLVDLQHALESYSFTGTHVALLQKDIDKQVRILVSEHVSFITPHIFGSRGLRLFTHSSQRS